jgi:hypothetical protein
MAASSVRCVKGHQNPVGGKFCSQCGAPIASTVVPAPPLAPAAEDRLAPAAGSAATTAEVNHVSELRIGATFTTSSGQQVMIRGTNGDAVWADVEENGRRMGTLRFSRTAVENALAKHVPLPTPSHQPAPPIKVPTTPGPTPETVAFQPPHPIAETPPPFGSPPPASAPPPSASGSGGDGMWKNLSPKAKFAVVSVPLGLVLLGMMISSGSRDDRSYQLGRELSLVSTAGYKVGCGMGLCDKDNGGTMTPESQCRHWIKHDYGDDVESQGLVLNDMVAGCLAGFGD